jgi:hypothetical protein
MGKVNKLTGGIFAEIVGGTTQSNSYDIFMNEDSDNTELKSYLERYRTIITKNKTEFEKMARLEEIIMQIRAKQNLDDIKLSLVREYIYARCAFFRKEKTSKDIRVIVDNIEFWNNSSMDDLAGNKEFMDKAKKKLIKAMNKEIEENIAIYSSLYK